MINYTAWTGRQDDETPTGDATDFLEKLPSTRRIENEGKAPTTWRLGRVSRK